VPWPSSSNPPLLLSQAVAIAPTVIYFDAEFSFQLYAGGVYKPTDCTTAINHAVTVVGYQWTGSSTGSYWIIKNSWGTSWVRAVVTDDSI
jgi:C1A family cysteine protease